MDVKAAYRPSYRPDIDGLRAVAVIAVVIYHLDKDLLPGGFTGVDVFFVVSGYVVSASLRKILLASVPGNASTTGKKGGNTTTGVEGEAGQHKELQPPPSTLDGPPKKENNQPTADVQAPAFSRREFLADFYARRIRRLYPALVAVFLVFTLLHAWIVPYWLLSFVPFADSGMLAIVGGANIFYAAQTLDYWSQDSVASSKMNPFLHTWSLGVEEQFYVIFSLLVCLFGNSVKHGLINSTGLYTVLLSILTIGSFVHCLLLQGTPDTSALAFYLVSSRFWEMSLGALMLQLEVWYMTKKIRESKNTRSGHIDTNTVAPAEAGLAVVEKNDESTAIRLHKLHQQKACGQKESATGVPVEIESAAFFKVAQQNQHPRKDSIVDMKEINHTPGLEPTATMTTNASSETATDSRPVSSSVSAASEQIADSLALNEALNVEGAHQMSDIKTGGLTENEMEQATKRKHVHAASWVLAKQRDMYLQYCNLSNASMVIIVASLLFSKSGEHFPIPFALISTIGTCLFIVAEWKVPKPDSKAEVLNHSKGPTPKTFNNLCRDEWMIYVGQISYCMYLVHWPVTVAFHWVKLSDTPKFGVVFPIIWVLSVLLYTYWEVPLRSAKLANIRSFRDLIAAVCGTENCACCGRTRRRTSDGSTATATEGDQKTGRNNTSVKALSKQQARLLERRRVFQFGAASIAVSALFWAFLRFAGGHQAIYTGEFDVLFNVPNPRNREPAPFRVSSALTLPSAPASAQTNWPKCACQWTGRNVEKTLPAPPPGRYTDTYSCAPASGISGTTISLATAAAADVCSADPTHDLVLTEHLTPLLSTASANDAPVCAFERAISYPLWSWNSMKDDGNYPWPAWDSLDTRSFFPEISQRLRRPTAAPVTWLLGDSHAATLTQTLLAATGERVVLVQTGIWLMMASDAGSLEFFQVVRAALQQEIRDGDRIAVTYSQDRVKTPDHVANWKNQLNALQQIAHTAGTSTKLILFKDVPALPKPGVMCFPMKWGLKLYDCRVEKQVLKQQRQAETTLFHELVSQDATKQTVSVDLLDPMCHKTYCDETVPGFPETVGYIDSHHLSDAAVYYLAPFVCHALHQQGR